jgi:hypothetical protein
VIPEKNGISATTLPSGEKIALCAFFDVTATTAIYTW